MRIAVAGPQCSGKSEIIHLLTKDLDEFEIIKFADPIYNTLSCLHQTKNRLFMQEFSDVSKKYFGEDIFVRIFSTNVQHSDYAHLFCDDVRYINELAKIHELGFISIYVDADEIVRKKRAALNNLVYNANHSSEDVEHLRGYCKYYINNSSSYIDLEDQTNQIRREILEGK